jgi:thiol-disulfide isomerase/thioredoxin
MKVLKFGAVWCSGCVIMKPRWQEIERENLWLKTEYYDYDIANDQAKKYSVKDLPCFIFLDKQNQEVERLTGEIDKLTLVEKINKYKDM